MSRLSILKDAVRLCLNISWRPFKRNKTSRLGVIETPARYKWLRLTIDDTNTEVAKFLQTDAQQNTSCGHAANLSDYKSVNELFQMENATVREFQTLFQSTIDIYPNFQSN